MRVAIIGAGPTGLAAAFDLCRAGQPVVCFESAKQVGRLAGGSGKEGGEWCRWEAAGSSVQTPLSFSRREV